MKKVIISAQERQAICTRDPAEDIYQTEKNLSEELIRILVNQGYEYRDDIKNEETLQNNLKRQLERLNRYGPRKENFSFSPSE